MFQGKTVVITGGSSGVGKELARRFLEQGACPALLARNEKRLASARDELAGNGPRASRVEVFPCDVTRTESVETALQGVVDALGVPDILVNSAGILREGYFDRQSLETFREVMDVNFFGTLHCIRSVLPLFEPKGGGRIVNLCSLAGLMGVFGYTAYCSSKHAVAGLTHTLRAELKPRNIRVHLVCPPEFDSPMVDEINRDRTPENRKIAGALPKLTAGEVADAIMAGIGKERYQIVPGRTARMAVRLDRWAPSLGRSLSDRLLLGCYQGPGRPTGS